MMSQVLIQQQCSSTTAAGHHLSKQRRGEGLYKVKQKKKHVLAAPRSTSVACVLKPPSSSM